MKEIELIQVIKTSLKVIGAGTPRDPHRRVTQFWSIDGDLLAEVDPVARSVTPDLMMEIFNSAHRDPDVTFTREAIMKALFGEEQP